MRFLLDNIYRDIVGSITIPNDSVSPSDILILITNLNYETKS